MFRNSQYFKERTHSKYSRIVRHLRSSWRFILFGRLLDPQVLDVAASEYDVFVHSVRRGDLILWVAAFSTPGDDVFEGDRRVVGIYFV